MCVCVRERGLFIYFTEGSVAHMTPVLGGTLCLCVVLDIYLIYLYYKKGTCLNCQGIFTDSLN